MRINKKIAPKYKIPYDQGLLYFKGVLLIIAGISVVINAYLSPALGFKALIIFVVAYLTAKFSEALFYVFSKNLEFNQALDTVEESFPEISGLIFALLVPIGTPIFAIIISVSFAVIIGKMAFGGFSFNIFNIGVIAAVIFYVSWPSYAVPHLVDGYWLDYLLSYISNNWFSGVFSLAPVVTDTTLQNANVIYPSYLFITTNVNAFLGFVPALVVIPLGIFLAVKKVIDYKIPLFISIFTIISGALIALFIKDYSYYDAIYYGVSALFSTMMLFIAFFVATDPVTSPNSTRGVLVYSIIIVVVTMYSRELTKNIEGVFYAILFANMLTPLINAKSDKFKILTRNILSIVGVLILVIASIFIGYNRSSIEEGTYTRYDYLNDGTSSEEVSEDASSSATAS